MKIPALLVFPLALFLLLLLLMVLHPGAATWGDSPTLTILPYLVFGMAALLGLFFAQSRVLFMALTLGILTLLLDHYVFGCQDLAKGSAIVFLAAVGVPALTAALYRLSERGVFNPHGATRAMAIAFYLLVLALLPQIPSFGQAVRSTPYALLKPISEWITVPAIGLVAFVGSLPFLLTGKEHESPALGSLLYFALLFCFAGLAFESALWAGGKGEPALLLFMSGAGITLVWAVLESAWRHANIDELTELPGRRVLKYHLRCLGSSYGIAVLDLDHFKSVNDKYGHEVGDHVRRFVAAELQRSAAGATFRYGGEEFVIVARNRELEDFVADLESLRYSISQREFVIRGPDRPARKPRRGSPNSSPRKRQALPLTVSIGVAMSNPRCASPQEVLEAADRALYRSKENGRNRVTVGK